MPFSRILKRCESKGSNINSQKVELHDSQIPFISKNGLVIGSFGGNLTYIPPPTSAEYCFLCYKSGEYCWVDLYPDVQDSKSVSWKI